MSILKSTGSGKFTQLTIEYMLSHGWHHPFLAQHGNEEIRKKDELVRDNGNRGKFSIVTWPSRTIEKSYLQCIILCPIRGMIDYQYRLIAEPKTIYDLELITKLFDCGDLYIPQRNHRKYNKQWNIISDLCHSDFCTYEVIHK